MIIITNDVYDNTECFISTLDYKKYNMNNRIRIRYKMYFIYHFYLKFDNF